MKVKNMKQNKMIATVVSIAIMLVTVVVISQNKKTDKKTVKENTAINNTNDSVNVVSEQPQILNNIIYEDASFDFKIALPLNWKDYVVRSREVSREFYGITYKINEFDFGFPVKLIYDESNKNINTEKCDVCFTNVFTLTVYNKSDFEEISRNNEAEIVKNGSTPFTDLGRLVGSNNRYIFTAPGNIHGQSYDGQFIYDRQTEAATFLSYFEALR